MPRTSDLLKTLSALPIRSRSVRNEDANIYQVCFLSDSSQAFDEGTVYISLLSTYCEHATMKRSSCPSLFFLIEEPEPCYFVSDFPDNYVLFAAGTKQDQLFQLVFSHINLYHRVGQAKLMISHALLDRVKIPEFLQLVSDLLGNPVLLQDTTTRLLAHSFIRTDSREGDEILDNLLSLGFVNASLFSKYDYANVLKTIENQSHAFFLESEKKSRRLIAPIRVRQRYFGWVLSIECRQPFQEGDLEIMDFLAGILSLLLEQEHPLALTSQCESLLLELLSPHSYTEESFKKRASGFSWELKGHYRVIVLSTPQGPSDNPIRTILAYKNHLSLEFPSMKAFLYQERLILFFDTPKIQLILEKLVPFLARYNLRGALSFPFHQILAFPDRCRQALSALSMGLKLGRPETLFSYEDYLVYDVAGRLKEAGNPLVFCIPQLLDAIRYDKKYHLDYTESIRTFVHSRSLSDAAAELHIHRNTMVYRVEKFQELTGLDLKDPAVLHRLWLSFAVLELYPEIWEEV